MEKFMNIVGRIVGWIDTVNEYVGRGVGWLMFILVLLVTVDTLSRKFLNTGWVAVQETEWWLYSIIFLMGAGYTFIYDGHVRVDIVYSRLSQRGKDYVDLTCAFIFLFPMCVLVIVTSNRFVASSWEVREYSPDPGGLPAYYVLKAVIPLGFTLLALQGLSTVFKIIKRIREENDEARRKDQAS